jgi:molybdopterin molybdotransferase
MPEFLTLLPPGSALEKWIAYLSPMAESEVVETAKALGRVTAEAVRAEQPLPAFARSTVDGYAVRAGDTYGASDSLPAYLRLIGEAPMGAAPGFSVGRGECGLIHTGGMLPEGTDAVVMVEHTQSARPEEVEVLRPVANGENVLKIGEDVQPGDVVISAGQRLRPAEIGGLMALGVLRLPVVRRPRVAVLSSGDEIVPPEQEPAPGQVRDVNAYTLSGLVEQAGGEPRRYGILPDRQEALAEAARQAVSECDLAIITAGSSASTRDLTADVINSLGEPGVLVHGVNVRPGKPTILGVCGGKGVIGLPGNPVSALVIATLFAVPAIEKLLGLDVPRLQPAVRARLGLNLASQAGREDWVAVRLQPAQDDSQVEYLAEPVFGKSNLIFTLARADGLLRIPPDANGLPAGAVVDVFLL